MAAGKPLHDLAEDLLCSICLDLFKEAVMLECGHSFCKSCVNKAWDTEKNPSCPECREVFPSKKYTVNRQLCKVVESSQRSCQYEKEEIPNQDQKSHYLLESHECTEHKEALKVFYVVVMGSSTMEQYMPDISAASDIDGDGGLTSTKSMAAGKPLYDLAEDLLCSICLDLFKEAVMLECGHSFCKSCVDKAWDTEKNPSCPECRQEFPSKKYTVNRQLCKVVESSQRSCQYEKEEIPNQDQKSHYLLGSHECTEHKEALKVFCQDDGCPVCVICMISSTHKGHTFIPILEAASMFQDEAQSLEQHITSEFAKLRQFLQDKEQQLIQQLKEEAAGILEKMTDNLEKIEEMNKAIQKHKSNIESTLQQEDSVLLLKMHNNIKLLVSSSQGITDEIKSVMKRLEEEEEVEEEVDEEEVEEEEEEIKSIMKRLEEEEEVEEEVDEEEVEEEEIEEEIKSIMKRLEEEEEVEEEVDEEEVEEEEIEEEIKSIMKRLEEEEEVEEEVDEEEVEEEEEEEEIQSVMKRLEEEEEVEEEVEKEQEEEMEQENNQEMEKVEEKPKKERKGVFNAELVSDSLSLGVYSGPLQYSIWKEMLSVINPGLCHLTLDPNTAHRRLTLSEDLTSVSGNGVKLQLSYNPKRYDSYASVLASQGFTSGRHYWEVEVGCKTQWELGVTKESSNRKGKVEIKPEDGYWILHLFDKMYWSMALSVPLPGRIVKPQKVGVYLDYERGQVSFYNADNMSHIYTFTDTFTERLYPYFWVGSSHLLSPFQKL
ncbi:nuclear factor 7, brain-like [Protopterus annectens]|uniref:nuclear factor 7, brain-like n=1 Tax=Protopterus annectens TaxID=7888 RepID=UPI001CFBB776|nr:nuclear factor 7, brain-like [Protopterus annectens]